MFEYQNDGVAWLSSTGNCLLADEPGLGKTIQAIEFLKNNCAGRALIVCPATLKHNWLCELTMTGVIENNIAVCFEKPNPGAKYVIINYDLLEKHRAKLQSVKWQVVIFDEAHYLKNRTAKRTMAAQVIAQKAEKIIFLTGTPIMNRPVEFLNLMKILAPKRYSPNDWFRQYIRYCAGFKSRYGWDFAGAAHLEELKQAWSSYVLRRRKEDVLSELPDKILQIVELTTDNLEVVLKERQTFEENVRSLGFQKAVEFENFSAERQEVALLKLDACIDHINNLLEEEEKLVIFAHHKSVVAKLKKGIKAVSVTLTGDSSMTERQKAVTEFQNDPHVRVFIGNIKAAGIGITLTAAKTCVFVETSFVPAEIEQACDRLHRIGQKDSVRCQFLVLKDSIDALILKVVIRKNKIIKKLID